MSILNNSFISVGTKIIQALLSIVSAVFLSRLIMPHDFGVFSIILATYGLFRGFLDVGLTASYIKADRVTQGLRNSFFTINVLLGITTTILLIASAPIISFVYGDAQLFSLMIAFSSTVFISSLGLQGLAELNRAKSFSKLMIINVVTTLGTVLISIGAAYSGLGVWTFIIAEFSRTSLQTGLVFYFNTDNKYNFAKSSLIKVYYKEIKFGAQVFFGRILNGIFYSMDKLLLGNGINANSLGQYKNSQQHARMVDSHLRMPIGSVIYSYIERYSDKDKKSTYFKFGIITLIITMMANGLLFLKGEEIYLFAFGDNWKEASIFIKYFSMFSMGIVLKGIYTTISMSEDKMNKQNALTLISILILGLNILIYFIYDISLLNFVKFFSISIFLYWSIMLTKEFYSFNSKNPFLIYITLSISIVGFCEIVRQFAVIDPINNFFLITFLYEFLMGLLLFYYIKIGIKK
jgi:O-antigen/teichoic acid export membrane protein